MKSPYEIKKEICEVGHTIYNLGFVAANDGTSLLKSARTSTTAHPPVYQRAHLLPI